MGCRVTSWGRVSDDRTNTLLVGLAKALASPAATAAWARTLSQAEMEEAWKACPDARALFRLCAPVTSAEILVRGACACLRHALAETKPPMRILGAAVDKLDAWARGEGAWRDVDVIGQKIVLALGGSESDVVNALAAASNPEDRTRAMDVVVELVKALADDGTTYGPSFARPARTRPTKTAVLAQLADVVRVAVPCPRVDDLAS